MPKLPIETPLEYLARRTFPDYYFLTGGSGGMLEPRLRPTAERVAEFEAWMTRHRALLKDELKRLVEVERGKEGEEKARLAEARERSRFFHQPDAAADFRYWGKMAHWTIDEAIALSMGKSPSLVSLENVQSHASPNFKDGLPGSPFAIEYLKRIELARRSVAWKELFDPILPSLFLRWAQRMEFDPPQALIEAVEARGLIVADWKDLYDKKNADHEALARRVAELEPLILKSAESLKTVSRDRDELRAQVSRQPTAAGTASSQAADSAGRWPWGAYETHLLRELAAAAGKWWSNFDAADNTTAPTNEQVSAWLQSRGVSRRTADTMASILRADKLPTGPRTSS